MTLNYRENIPPDFADDSRIWIYQSNRNLTDSEVKEINWSLQEFALNWTSHADKVKGFAKTFFGRFIIFMADETATGISGCSTDSSVRLVKSLENKFNVQLLERLNLAFFIDGEIKNFPLSILEKALENDLINTGTLYFNNTVQTKKELMEKWIIPVSESWLPVGSG